MVDVEIEVRQPSHASIRVACASPEIETEVGDTHVTATTIKRRSARVLQRAVRRMLGLLLSLNWRANEHSRVWENKTYRGVTKKDCYNTTQ